MYSCSQARAQYCILLQNWSGYSPKASVCFEFIFLSPIREQDDRPSLHDHTKTGRDGGGGQRGGCASCDKGNEFVIVPAATMLFKRVSSQKCVTDVSLPPSAERPMGSWHSELALRLPVQGFMTTCAFTWMASSGGVVKAGYCTTPYALSSQGKPPLTHPAHPPLPQVTSFKF